MFPEDIDNVFNMIPVGAKVTVVDQPIKAAWIDDELYLEVHPTQEQATLMEREGAVPDYELSERDLAYIMRVAGPAVEKLDWNKIRKVVKERKGYPVEIAQRAANRPAVQPTSAAATPKTETPKTEPVKPVAEKPVAKKKESAKIAQQESAQEQPKIFYRD